MSDTLFDDLVIDTPETQAIKYTGSKLKLLSYILNLSKKVSGDVKNATVFDGFSGSTRVSQAYAKTGYKVYANDIAPYTKVFNTAFLMNTKEPKKYQPLIDHLNSLKPVDGWFTEHYGGDGNHKISTNSDGLKKPWQKKNTRKLDAIREEIDKLNLDEVTKAVTITSLIFALDKVDSTLGHYASYLSEWSPRSYNDMKLEVPDLWVNKEKNVVLNQDVFEAIKMLPDNIIIAYFDPPYGSNNEKMPPSRVRYASYYHIWTTIIKNDKPKLFGKVGRREDSRDLIASSLFEEFRKDKEGSYIAMQAIRKMIKTVKSRYILLSYSSGGRATKQELRDIINEFGKLIKVIEIDYQKNVMAGMRWTNEWISKNDKHQEYIFLIEKT